MSALTSAELAAGRKGKVLVDIRKPDEWRTTGIIDGCHRLTYNGQDLDGWLEDLEQIATPDDELVLVCRTGHRTGILLDYLHRQTPYRQARHLAGGILDWIANGLPVVAIEK